MMRLPSFPNQSKVDNFLIKDMYNPFPAPPASADLHKNPAQFIIGRDKELNQIGNAIQESLKFPESKLIILQGKQGIGKSTIISSIPNYLEEHNLKNNVMIVYFNTSNDKNDFRLQNFYRQTIEELEKTKFLEKVVYSALRRILLLGEQVGGKLSEDMRSLPLTPEYLKKIKENQFFLKNLFYEKIPVLQIKIKEYIKRNYRILKSYVDVDDFDFLFTLIDSVIGDNTYTATKALKGGVDYSGFKINTDNMALNAFNNLKQLIRWVYGEATFLVIFDHLEGGLSNSKEVYQQLFSLLIRLRQQHHGCILISGTLDAFDGFYKVLEEDMKLQIDSWVSVYETLRPLNVESVINIVKKRLDNFWTSSNFQPPHQYTLYPFGRESIAYLYDRTFEDIRKTLVSLHDRVEDFKRNQNVEPIINFFEAFSKLRQEKNLLLKSQEINYFSRKLLDPTIQDKNRSTRAELVICQLLKILRKKDPNITEVKHEPKIGRKKLKPDVYIELFGGLTLKQMKRMGIEVKIFRVSEVVRSKEVKKTHSLVINGDLDYIFWITTVPLSSAKHDLPEEYKSHIGRTSPLSKEEQAYLSFAIHFEDIYGRKPDPQEADLLLQRIGLRMEEIINMMKEAIPTPKRKLVPVEVKPPRIEPAPVIRRKPKVIQTTISPTPTPTSSIMAQAKEINSKISTFITKRSASGKTFVNKSTIVKHMMDKFKIQILSNEDKEQIHILITEIAKKKGLRVTPARVYFS